MSWMGWRRSGLHEPYNAHLTKSALNASRTSGFAGGISDDDTLHFCAPADCVPALRTAVAVEDDNVSEWSDSTPPPRRLPQVAPSAPGEGQAVNRPFSDAVTGEARRAGA